MNLGEYLYIRKKQFALRFLNFYYYQNGKNNMLINLKTGKKMVLDALTREMSLSEILQIPVSFGQPDIFQTFEERFRIEFEGELVYMETARQTKLTDDSPLVRLTSFGTKTESHQSITWNFKRKTRGKGFEYKATQELNRIGDNLYWFAGKSREVKDTGELVFAPYVSQIIMAGIDPVDFAEPRPMVRSRYSLATIGV